MDKTRFNPIISTPRKHSLFLFSAIKYKELESSLACCIPVAGSWPENGLKTSEVGGIMVIP